MLVEFPVIVSVAVGAASTVLAAIDIPVAALSVVDALPVRFTPDVTNEILLNAKLEPTAATVALELDT
jgi:hypothetical protein